MYTSIKAIALFATAAAAKRCINATVPVEISARQAIFDIEIPSTNLECMDFALNVTKQGQNFTDIALVGYNTTSGTYNISTQLCMPDNDNGTNPTIQVLTHGIGFDKTYWDLSINNFNYSYVDVATDEYGYYTLAIDRLGIGNSSHGEPLNEIQSYLEVAATTELTRQLREGTFPSMPNQTFNKVVHVGHSFGSAQSYSLANLSPNMTDAIVLTGFSMNASFVSLFVAGANFQLAKLNQPLKFGSANGTQIQNLLAEYVEPLNSFLAPIDLSNLPATQNLPNGYLISGNGEAGKYLFLKPKFYDPAVGTLAEQTKQPVTLGEVLTLGSLVPQNAFAGPVLVITGDSDLPYCGGDCLATGGAAASIPAGVQMNFPNVAPENFSTIIQPNTGHGINFHYNATAAYRLINEFLNSKNLQSS